MIRRTLGFFSLAWLLVACGGSVDNSQGTGGHAGSGGSGAVAGSGGAPGGTGGIGGGPIGGFGGGPGGDGGGPVGGFGGVGGTGGAPSCLQTSDGLGITVSTTLGPAPSCTSEPTDYEVTGSVVKSDNNILVIDTCPPNADCIGMMQTTVQLDATDLYLWVPTGAFVDVHYVLTPTWGACTSGLTIQNVANWAGIPNPVFADDHFYFIGTDGDANPPPGAPFTVTPVPLGCTNETGCGGVPPDMYALSFAMLYSGQTTLVGMGQTASIFSNTQALMVKNLRSYQSSACDDYWNWAWWATDEPPLGD